MPDATPSKRVCSVPGCERRVDPRGYCHGHIQRLYRLGDVVPEVPLGGAARVASARRARRESLEAQTRGEASGDGG